MVSLRDKRVPLAGYTDRLSARPGDSVEFRLSASGADKHSSIPVNARLTQCICADPNPAGPGIQERSAQQWFEPCVHQVHEQPVRAGSYGITAPVKIDQATTRIVFTALVWPTLLNGTIQGIASFGALSLCISESNTLACRLGDQLICHSHALAPRVWRRATLVIDLAAEKSSVALTLDSVDSTDSRASSDSLIIEHKLSTDQFEEISHTLAAEHALIIAAQEEDGHGSFCFNGKIEAPVISFESEKPGDKTVHTWDLSKNMSQRSVPGVHAHTPTLELRNYPTRAMTGSAWKAQEMCWRHAPELYAAIHFHEDDISDFQWQTTFTWQVPQGMPSGVYIMRISDGVNEDAMPLFICTPKGQRDHRIAFLVPTFTYAIYGNHARPDWDSSWQQQVRQWNAYPHNPAEYPGYGLSTYNYHTDGTGICHASHLRPLFNLRPGYITFAKSTCSGLRHLQADSHLLAWLDAQDIGFDVITDRELHEEGSQCIEGYDMLLTSTHPEYHTSRTLDALTAYRDSGGHLSYLGGNGFYWRIALHPEDESVLEIRRAEDGIRAWAAEPGEYYQAFDGEYGGLWRRNGRPPQALCGLGFTAQGQFNGSYYRRRKVADDLAWILAGIDDELIGDFGLCGGGAAGFELDRADTQLGTPVDATIIASSENHGDDFILVPEEMLTHITTLPGPDASELLRADIVWFELPGGGSVFSVGSITFCGSLPHNDFDNSVSRLLLNVVQRVCGSAQTGSSA